jgi:neuroligin
MKTGLFSRALLMAGSALSPASLAADPRSVKDQVARQMECRESPSPDADIGDCLRKKPLAALLSIQLETPRFWPGFAPFIDGYIVPVDPLVAMQSTSNNFHNFPLLAGVTSLESYRFIRCATVSVLRDQRSVRLTPM